MSDLFGNHIVGFPTRRLKCYPGVIIFSSHSTSRSCIPFVAAEHVRQTRVSQLHKGTNSTEDMYGKPERPPLKSLPGVVLALLKNPPFLFTTLGGVFDFFIGSGMVTFLPKFLQNNYHVSSSQAGIYSGE